MKGWLGKKSCTIRLLFCICCLVTIIVLLYGGVVRPAEAQELPAEIDASLVSHEIRYYMPEAGEVWLVWGVDGWQILPEEIRPSDTLITENLMHTPMSHHNDYFTAHIQFPEQATVEYGFLITQARDGTEIQDTWDGVDESIVATGASITEIFTNRSLPRGPFIDFATDLELRGRAMLQLVLGFLLFFGVVAAAATRPLSASVRQLARRVDVGVAELAFSFITFKLILLGIGYLTVTAFDSANPGIVPFHLAHWEELQAAFGRGDVQWYLSIAEGGYENRPFSADTLANWAFYPLWPLAMGLGHYLSVDILTWGIWLANGLSILAIVALYRLMLLDFDKSIAQLTVVFAMTFPGAYYLMRPGPEALFFLLTVLSLYAAKKHRWLLAGVLGGLAVLTRLQGLLLLFPLLYLYYRYYKETHQHDITAVAFLLIPAALLGFMTHLYFITGNFFATFHIQSAWDHHQSYPFAAMVRFLSNPLLVDYYGWNLTPLSFIFLFLAIGIAIVAATRKGFPQELLIYMLLSLYVVASRDNLNATIRYLLPVFPLFLTLALLFHKRQILVISVLFLFIVLQAFYFVAFARGIHWAVT